MKKHLAIQRNLGIAVSSPTSVIETRAIRPSGEIDPLRKAMRSHAANLWGGFFVASFLSLSTVAMAQSAAPAIGQFICPGTTLIRDSGLSYPQGSVPKIWQLAIAAPTKIVRVEVLSNSHNRAQAYILLEGQRRDFYVYPPESGGPAQSTCGSSGAHEPTAAIPQPLGQKKPEGPQPVATTETQQPELMRALQGRYHPTDAPEKLMDLVWTTILLKCQRPAEKEPSIFYETLTTEDGNAIAPNGGLEGQTKESFGIREFGGPFRFETSPVRRDFSPAQIRNTGIKWSIQSKLLATTYRGAFLKLVHWDKRGILDLRFSYKSPWSKWFDDQENSLAVIVTLDNDGLHFSPSDWHRMSCDVISNADDPFASYHVNVMK
jgi:hypothetical protein